MKDVADLIVKLGERAVEAKELFQGRGHRSRSLGSFLAGGREECLLSVKHRVYMSNYLPSSTMHNQWKGSKYRVVDTGMLI